LVALRRALHRPSAGRRDVAITGAELALLVGRLRAAATRVEARLRRAALTDRSAAGLGVAGLTGAGLTAVHRRREAARRATLLMRRRRVVALGRHVRTRAGLAAEACRGHAVVLPDSLRAGVKAAFTCRVRNESPAGIPTGVTAAGVTGARG
jgi:hypothetical protein